MKLIESKASEVQTKKELGIEDPKVKEGIQIMKGKLKEDAVHEGAGGDDRKPGD